MKNWRAKFFTYFGIGFFVLEILFLFANFFTHCFFWFDENDAYVAGPIRYIALWIQIAMFGFSNIATFVEVCKTEVVEKTVILQTSFQITNVQFFLMHSFLSK